MFISILTAMLLFSIVLNGYLWIFFTKVTSGPWEATYEPGDSRQRIVILPIGGIITDTTAQFVRASLAILRDNPPAAIVLQIDSPGGAIGPCDRILHQLNEYKQQKNIKIVASFGTLAASGGYYVATVADYIIAEPLTTTGSIGVMAPIFTFDRLLDKIGVTPEIIVAPQSPDKDLANNVVRPWTERDRARVRQRLESAQERFIDVVYEGRKDYLSREQVRVLGRGDVYSTQEAIDNKLVDGDGYLGKAIDKAKELAGIAAADQPEVTVMQSPYGLNLLNVVGATNQPSEGIALSQIREWVRELSTPRLSYRWP